MFRALSIALCLLLATALASAQVIHVEGEIVDGMFALESESGSVLTPFDDFPVPYTGLFDYRRGIESATFQFEVDFGDQQESYAVNDNLFAGVLQNDAVALEVDYESTGPLFITSFQLSLDKLAGEGSWSWDQDCPVCDLQLLPLVHSATITSYREVPEPGSASLLAICLVALVSRRAGRVPG